MRAWLALLAGVLASPCQAQMAPASLQFPVPPTVLERIVRHGEVRLAVPADAPPFAWTGLDGQPAGYAVEACRRVAAAVAAELGLVSAEPRAAARPHALAVVFVDVPVADEAAAVASGAADLGCSAVPPGPGAHLAASPPLAVSGVRLLAARLGDVSSADDLAGGTVAAVAGSQAEAVLRRIAAALSPPARVVGVPSPGDGYELVATGGADAFAADDLLLAGLLATRTDGPSFHIVGRELSHGPLALLSRGDDPAFARLVRRTVENMAGDGTLRARYVRWFTEPVPGGAALDRAPPPDTAPPFSLRPQERPEAGLRQHGGIQDRGTRGGPA